MSLHRTTIRDAVRSGILANARFTGKITARRSWVQNIDGDGLPSLTVATPRELVQSIANDDQRRQIDLVILLQRQGGNDLEDIADLDAEVIEAVVPAVVEPIGNVLDVALSLTEFRLSGTEAGKRISSLEMRFAVTMITARPA